MPAETPNLSTIESRQAFVNQHMVRLSKHLDSERPKFVESQSDKFTPLMKEAMFEKLNEKVNEMVTFAREHAEQKEKSKDKDEDLALLTQQLSEAREERQQKYWAGYNVCEELR